MDAFIDTQQWKRNQAEWNINHYVKRALIDLRRQRGRKFWQTFGESHRPEHLKKWPKKCENRINQDGFDRLTQWRIWPKTRCALHYSDFRMKCHKFTVQTITNVPTVVCTNISMPPTSSDCFVPLQYTPQMKDGSFTPQSNKRTVNPTAMRKKIIAQS